MRLVLAALLAFLAAAAAAASPLQGYDEAPDLAAALARVRAEPQRHVLLYFDQSSFCPVCREVREIVNTEAVRLKWRPNYVVVWIDLLAPAPGHRELIEQVRVTHAPVFVFLNAEGRRVAYSRQLRSERDAFQLDELVSQKQYALSTVGRYSAQDFRAAPADPYARFVVVGAKPVDDRPRLRDVLSRDHRRLTGEDLKALLPGRRMHKENREWFLTLDLRERKLLEATGERKDGRGKMQGAGKWYVTKKGKLCLELQTRGVDEMWCRHVFQAGDTYYVVKDLRPERVAYRFALGAL